MRKPILAGLSLLTLSGCATVWHRPETPKSTMEMDLTHCETQAAAKYPPRIVTVQTSPGYMQPSTQECWHRHGYFYCQEYPAQWVPSQYGNEDTNAGPRRAWVHACMRALGYKN